MGTPPDDLFEGLALEGAPVVHREGDLHAGDRVVGHVHGRRIEWSLPMDEALAERVSVERRLFDAHSAALRLSLRAAEPARSAAAWLDLRRREHPPLRELVSRLPPLAGARVLELGGSGEATRGLLRAGARRIDQIDVSPGMQALARARLEPDEARRVVQHTTAAERLPFASGTFDLVYSRHCLHHMDRARVVPEVARVLAPKGALFAIEPYVPRALMELVRLRRRIARVERGTDHPLGPRDLALLRACFGRVEIEAEPFLTTLVRAWPALSRAARARGVDELLPACAAYVVGGRVHVLASRPV